MLVLDRIPSKEMISQFSSQPLVLKQKILNSLLAKPSIITLNEVTYSGRMIVSLTLVNKELNGICSEKLFKFKKVYEMIIKYHEFNASYENACRPDPSVLINKPVKICGNPQLFDALLSGSGIPMSCSFEEFTPEVEEDIKMIVKLNPESFTYNLTSLGLARTVPPIFLACTNEQVSVSIVEFLLASGVDPHSIYDDNGIPTSVILGIEGKFDSTRYEVIFDLFKKYGLDPMHPIFEGIVNDRLESFKVVNSAAAAE